jgi:hypothetical protein
MGGKGEGWEKRVSEKGQNELLVWGARISAQEKEKE